MGEFVKVATIDEIPSGQGKVFEVNGLSVAVFNVNGRFFASSSVCPHEDGPLGDGTIEGDAVVCPWHGFDFDLKTGACLVDPELKVPIYPTKVDGKDILVQTT
ncbi:MAG TPA: Rieske 2Fe-2S domain-containing protein [Methylomirabilota bacterium]|nr:Rieske 2Fe-2S domain-containing protein [Methylomirabilota bacterium]